MKRTSSNSNMDITFEKRARTSLSQSSQFAQTDAAPLMLQHINDENESILSTIISQIQRLKGSFDDNDIIFVESMLLRGAIYGPKLAPAFCFMDFALQEAISAYEDVLTVPDAHGNTALHYAALYDDAVTVDLYLMSVTDRQRTLECKGRFGLTPLLYACAFGSAKALKRLLACDEEHSGVKIRDMLGNGALYLSALSATDQALYSKGARPNEYSAWLCVRLLLETAQLAFDENLLPVLHVVPATIRGLFGLYFPEFGGQCIEQNSAPTPFNTTGVGHIINPQAPLLWNMQGMTCNWDEELMHTAPSSSVKRKYHTVMRPLAITVTLNRALQVGILPIVRLVVNQRYTLPRRSKFYPTWFIKLK